MSIAAQIIMFPSPQISNCGPAGNLKRKVSIFEQNTECPVQLRFGRKVWASETEEPNHAELQLS